MTLALARDIASWLLLLSGSFFFIVGAVGMVRMPDVYTRMHASSVTETLGCGLLIAGMMLQAGWGAGERQTVPAWRIVFSDCTGCNPCAGASSAAHGHPATIEGRGRPRKRHADSVCSRRSARPRERERMIVSLIYMVLLTLMATVTIGVVRVRNLFAVVILGGIYSFLMASVLIVLDAVDVAMTEAAVGAGISTVLMLAALYLTKTEESPPVHTAAIPLFVAIVTGAALVYGTLDLPPFGIADTPMHNHLAAKFLADSIKETTVPNVVTSILADYRGFDTLGETTVIFTAGIAVLLMFKTSNRRREKSQTDKGDSA